MSDALSVRGLTVTTPRGRTLLSVGTLDAEQGSLIGVQGPSGAGKSTFLYALAGLLDIATGEIRWGMQDILALTPGARAAFRAEKLGMVFQDFLLFEELSAAGNAGVTSLFRPRHQRRAVTDRAVERLDRLGIGATGRTVATFSGGERQRVAVARALASDPGIVLADEPTASLHRGAADALIDDLVAMVRDRGTTMVVVSHDHALIERMDRVVTIEDGRIVTDRRRAAA